MALDIFEGGEVEAPDAEVVRLKINEILSKRNKMPIIDTVDGIQDYRWVKESMMASGIKLDPLNDQNRFWSSADRKFTDTSLGGNYVVNPRPQFTPYCDTRARGILNNRNEVSLTATSGNLGLGIYYSEAIDDTHQTIHLRFGVPEHNSMWGFFTSFYDNDAGRYAKSGRMTSDFVYYIFKGTALVLQLVYWPILAAHVIGTALKFFMKKPASKFYYLKPNMHAYWTAVTTMVNQIAVYKRMFPWAEGTEQVGESAKVDAASIAAMSKMMPNIYSSNGFFDVYAIANRAQRIKNKYDQDMAKAYNSGTYDSWIGYVKKQGDTNIEPVRGNSLIEMARIWVKSAVGKNQKDDEGSALEKSMRSMPKPGSNELPGEPAGFLDYLTAEYQDGSQFATFRVDPTGTVQESFTSSTVESDISSKFNSLSAQGRAAQFTFSGGNIDGGVFSAVAAATTSAIQGTLSALNMSGLVSLAGSAFVDIPQHWDNSAANMPTMSYTMQLVSPYGNPMSQMINITIPLCMILAGALPLSTGKQSYTAPFICELYDQGKAQSRLAIMDSLTIVRGTTSLGFNKAKEFMSVDISMTFKDLSSVMHMPLQSGFSLNPLKGVFDEDTVYTDYLNVLASATLGQNVYPSNKVFLNTINKFRTIQSVTSPAKLAMVIHETPLGYFDLLFKETSRK